MSSKYLAARNKGSRIKRKKNDNADQDLLSADTNKWRVAARSYKLAKDRQG